MPENESLTPEVAFLSPDGQLISVDGVWYRVTPEAPLSPDGQFILVAGNWRRVQRMPAVQQMPPVQQSPAFQQMPPVQQMPAPRPVEFGQSPLQAGPPIRTYAQPRQTSGRFAPLTATIRNQKVGFGIAAAAIVALVTVLAWPSGSTSAPAAAAQQASANHITTPTPTPTPSATPTSSIHTLTGTITVNAPYAEVTGGLCSASDVTRILQNDGTAAIPYPDPAPPRFTDVTVRSPFTLKNASGAVVATGQLDSGTLVHRWLETSPGYPDTDPGLDLPSVAVSSSNNGFCQYSFTVPNVPNSDFYQLQFGSEPPLTISSASLQSNDWQYAGSLGNAAAAKSETDIWYQNICLKAEGIGGNCDAGDPGSTTA